MPENHHAVESRHVESLACFNGVWFDKRALRRVWHGIGVSNLGIPWTGPCRGRRSMLIHVHWSDGVSFAKFRHVCRLPYECGSL